MLSGLGNAQVKGSSPFNGFNNIHHPPCSLAQVKGSSPFNGSCDELFLNGEGLIFWNAIMTQGVWVISAQSPLAYL